MRWGRKVEVLASEVLDVPPSVVLELTAAGLRCRLPAEGHADDPNAGGTTVQCRPAALPFTSGSLSGLLLSFIGADPPPAERQVLLAEIARALAPDATLVVVDHNRPRRRAAALAALVRSPAIPGASPSARWRRAAYPTAREVQGAGLAVERLRLAAGERVQLVLARAARMTRRK